jgi:hypothetical protein
MLKTRAGDDACPCFCMNVELANFLLEMMGSGIQMDTGLPKKPGNPNV